MNDLLRFFKSNEVGIYILLGLVGIFYLRKFILSLGEYRRAMFGLERDNAQRRLSEAVSVLAIVLVMTSSEFILVSFISPNYARVQALPTPTLDVLTTPTATLAGTTSPATSRAVTQATIPVTSFNTPNSTCTAGQVEFTSPKNGDKVSGKVELKGSANIPNFGFYKYEFAQPGNPNAWTTIQAGGQPRCTGENCGTAATPSAIETAQATDESDQLGEWDTSQLTPGDYLLRLVVLDNQNQAYPACVIQLSVTAP